MDFPDVDRAALTAAIKRLEQPGFAGKMTTLAGRPAELVVRALPGPAAAIVAKAAEAALTRALDIALFSLCDRRFIVHRRAGGALGISLRLGSGGRRLRPRRAARRAAHINRDHAAHDR
jgi:hypothetical protein